MTYGKQHEQRQTSDILPKELAYMDDISKTERDIKIQTLLILIKSRKL